MITMGQNLKMIPPGIPGKSLSLKLMEDIFVLPVRNMMRIFKENRPFLRFEVFFFMYGMAFMIASPAVPIYLEEVLQLSYSPISIAKGLVFYTATILFTAFQHGKIERAHALELCAMPERSGRRLLSQLKSEGLLSETRSKSALRWEIPEHAEPWYFPQLI